jgi:hypothetical protein
MKDLKTADVPDDIRNGNLSDTSEKLNCTEKLAW